MMSARETATQYDEEGAEEEYGQEERPAGSAGAASEDSTLRRFTASCVALRRINSLLMAPMT